MAVISFTLYAYSIEANLASRATGSSPGSSGLLNYAWFWCDTEAELPAGNAVDGDQAYTLDSMRTWVRTAGAWVVQPALATVVQNASGTALPIGEVADGQFLKRVGAEIVGASGGGGGADWGDITGTLSAQTDLQTALDGKQPLDADLTTIAGLTATTDHFMVSAASAWASRTPTQAKTSLALVKGDVGLGNVDNTSDANKPVSTATQTAFDAKATTSHAATHLSGGSDPLAAATTTARGTVELATDGESAASLEPQANDARLSNARTPTAHATSHVTGGTDVIAPAVAAGNSGLMTGADKTKLDGITGTNTGDQTITLTGDVTGSGTGSFAATIAAAAVTLAKMANMATANIIYRKTAGTGVPEVQTLATLKTDLVLVKADVGLGNADNTSDANKPVSTATQTALDAKQATLVSGTNIKTVNGSTLLGSGDLAVSASDPSYTPGSFTVATGTGRLVIKRMQLVTTERATVAGTARLRVA